MAGYLFDKIDACRVGKISRTDFILYWQATRTAGDDEETVKKNAIAVKDKQPESSSSPD